MCVEKTPWEQVTDFHGHVCPEIALGFRIAQIAMREAGLPPNKEAELLIQAETYSCALDAFQVLNHCTIGRGTLRVDEQGKHRYKVQYTGTDEILVITVKPEVLENISWSVEDLSPRERQSKTMDAIQLILGCQEDNFCTIQRSAGQLEKRQYRTFWTRCPQCQEAVLTDYTVLAGEHMYCINCAK